MPVRVVIAEDEWLVAAALRRQVELSGYEVVGTVGTGSAALAACRAEGPDLVLMDVQMPEMDGLAATREIMQACPTCVVIVTGRAQLEQAARQAGAMSYVMKPLLGSQIPRVVEAARQRFRRFEEVRRASASPEEAVETWQAVQRAIDVLVGRDSLSEDDALAHLQQHAREQSLPLRAAAEELIRELNGQTS